MKAHSALVLAALVLNVLCGTYCSQLIREGWYPAQEGLLCEDANRAGRGEIAFIDYEPISPIGTTYWHVLWMSLAGESLLTPRVSVVIAGLVAFSIMLTGLRSHLPLLIAMLIGLCGFLWGPIHYLVAQPEWYGVYLALVCAVCLSEFSSQYKTSWLTAAGGIAGTAFLMSPFAGLLSLVASLLFLNYQLIICGTHPGNPRISARITCLSVLVVLSAYLFRAVPNFSIGEVLLFFVPVVCLSALFLSSPGQTHPCQDKVTPEARGQLVSVIFIGCAALPTILFGTFLTLSHGWSNACQVLSGHFTGIIPSGSMSSSIPTDRTLVLVVSINVVLLGGYLLHRKKAASIWAGSLVVASLLILYYGLYTSYQPDRYQECWLFVRLLLTEAVFVGVICLWAGITGKLSISAAQYRLLSVSTIFASVMSIIQLPEGTALTFLYTIPSLMLLLASLASILLVFDAPAKMMKWRQIGVVGLLGFLLIFPPALLRKSDATEFGNIRRPKLIQDYLHLERGGQVWVTWKECEHYETAVLAIEACSAAQDTILAFPNQPMLYFLSNRANPLRHYEAPRMDGSVWRGIMDTIEKYDPVIAVYQDGIGSYQLFRDHQLAADLNQRWPAFVKYGNLYVMSAKEPWEARNYNYNVFLDKPENRERLNRFRPPLNQINIRVSD